MQAPKKGFLGFKLVLEDSMKNTIEGKSIDSKFGDIFYSTMRRESIQLEYNGETFPLYFLPGRGMIFITNTSERSNHSSCGIYTPKPIRIREVPNGSLSNYFINDIWVEEYIKNLREFLSQHESVQHDAQQTLQ